VSERDFVVKNGLQVNNGVWVVNTAGIFYSGAQWANSTFLNQRANTALTANNANNLNGVAAASYLTNTGNFTVSGNINFTGSNVQFTTIRSGSNTVANSSGFYSDGQKLGGGGYFKGNNGAIGSVISKNDLYRVNSNTQNSNITIENGENAMTTGPIVIADGFNLTVAEGGRVVVA
jgi:hypothetical protein